MIDFESSTEIERKKNFEREARASILENAQRKYEARERKEQIAKERGDNHWLLPSVDAKIGGEKTKKKKEKKSKKEKKMKKKKKKKKESSSSSSSDDDEEDLWVERKKPQETKPIQTVPILSSEAPKRDEWMEVTSLFSSYTRKDLRTQKKEELNAKKEEKKPGSHSRELNPYYKSGGTGLPNASAKPSSSPQGYDVSWLHRALQRAKDQAQTEDKTLEEVAASRWGSLEQFYKLLSEAEKAEQRASNADPKSGRSRHEEDYKRHNYRKDSYDRHRHSPKHRTRSHSRSSSNSSDNERSARKRKINRDSIKKNNCDIARERRGMLRPPSDDEAPRAVRRETLPSSGNSTNRHGGWRKKKHESVDISAKPESSSSSSSSSDEDIKPEIMKSTQNIEEPSNVESPEPPQEEVSSTAPPKILTEKEMNHLAARMTKAELTGNQALADKLKAKLEAARSARENSAKICASLKEDSGKTKEEVILLTRTDSRGTSRPISQQESSSQGQKGKKRPKLFTHDEEGKRTIYFPDDQRYNLKQMFEKEKSTTVDEQNALFEKAAMGNVERLTDDFDIDDMFVSKAALKDSFAKQQERDRKLAIKEHLISEKILENCHLCIDNKEMKKHLIISLGTKCYLSLPGHEPLTEGHCILSPMSHVASSTRADEDVWQEIQEMRKCLVKMYEGQEEDCVFFETCRNYKNLPHMAIHCVPLPREVGDLAPIYFKKAIQECEEEWSQNKKLVDLKGRDVRRAVPKELPYFFVDFGLSPGFAHVIEDERHFKSNFAQEVIGGMIDTDPRLWRKPRMEEFEAQRKRVITFAKLFKNFDPNR